MIKYIWAFAAWCIVNVVGFNFVFYFLSLNSWVAFFGGILLLLGLITVNILTCRWIKAEQLKLKGEITNEKTDGVV